MRTRFLASWRRSLSIALLLAPFAAGCDTVGGWIAGGTAAMVIGGNSPTQSIEQTYYVGIFDPLEQLPPAVYRLTVRGQASAISSMRFASGWVPAPLVDGLGSRIDFDEQGRIKIDRTDDDAASLASSRRMMLFGPEGFREAPKDHRLAIVMGASPQAFFDALQGGLAAVVSVQQEQLESAESERILEELYRLRGERESIDEVADRIEAARNNEEGK